MSFDLTLGRAEPCKNSVGGLKAVYFVNYGAMGTVTIDALTEELTAISATLPDAFKYELKGGNTFTQVGNSSRENGTTFFEQTLEFTVKGLTVADNKELKLLSYGRPHVIVETNNGDLFIAGLEHGMEVTSLTANTGTAMGDAYGYTISMVGQEKILANFLKDPIDGNFTIIP